MFAGYLIGFGEWTSEHQFGEKFRKLFFFFRKQDFKPYISDIHGGVCLPLSTETNSEKGGEVAGNTREIREAETEVWYQKIV